MKHASKRMLYIRKVPEIMYTAKEAAERTGLTTAALRYYEKEQLLPAIARNAVGYRQYSEEDLEWIQMVHCLRDAGVPVRSIRQYMQLLMQGGTTIPQRRAMVQQYCEDLRAQKACIESALALTERKAAFYDRLVTAPCSALSPYEEWELFRMERMDETWRQS